MASTVKIAITYCAECGYDLQALSLTGKLLTEYGTRLTAIELIPWFDGAFDVSIDGELVHSMFRDGGFPRNEDIVRAVGERLSTKAGG